MEIGSRLQVSDQEEYFREVYLTLHHRCQNCASEKKEGLGREDNRTFTRKVPKVDGEPLPTQCLQPTDVIIGGGLSRESSWQLHMPKLSLNVSTIRSASESLFGNQLSALQGSDHARMFLPAEQSHAFRNY